MRYKEVKSGETVIKTASKPVDIIIKVKENQSVPTGIAVTGESAIDANDGKISEAGYTDVTAEGLKELTAKDKLTLAADETEKIITIAVTAKGNYSGTAYGTYEVKKPSAELIDLSKAKIVAKAKIAKGKDVKVGKQEYNGAPIEPEIRVLARVNKKWVEVDPSLYTVSYINNLNKGSATILVTGDGEEAIGSKTVKFKIGTMRFELFRLIFGK